MPIAIGQAPQSDFRNPLGLLSDCHRRIERFLGGLIAIAEQAKGSRLDEDYRHQWEVALRYFREAAPKHTQDEEESLFPRLQAHRTTETDAAFALVERLHADHQSAETLHQRVDDLGRKWLRQDFLSLDDAKLLISLLTELEQTYAKHIALEEDELFHLAEETLNQSELEAIAREMAARRGLLV